MEQAFWLTYERSQRWTFAAPLQPVSSAARLAETTLCKAPLLRLLRVFLSLRSSTQSVYVTSLVSPNSCISTATGCPNAVGYVCSCFLERKGFVQLVSFRYDVLKLFPLGSASFIWGVKLPSRCCSEESTEFRCVSACFGAKQSETRTSKQLTYSLDRWLGEHDLISQVTAPFWAQVTKHRLTETIELLGDLEQELSTGCCPS